MRKQRGRRQVCLKVDHKMAEMEKPQKVSKDVPAAVVHLGKYKSCVLAICRQWVEHLTAGKALKNAAWQT